MKIDGKDLADKILEKLQKRTEEFKQKGITPTLAVILVGDDPGSASFVRQKEKAAERIGAELRITNYELGITKKEIESTIRQLNDDPTVHGIIIQLPLPPHIDISINRSVAPSKDVDGFVPGSQFQVPVAMAVEKIVKKMYELRFKNYEENAFVLWLKKQNIVVVGRGETAGRPIAERFINQGCKVSVVHSQTSEEEKQHKMKSADIIISCVGKMQVIRGATLKRIEATYTAETANQGATLISVGICRDSEGKLHGDYEEEDVKDAAAFYTPTPGGVGPVNVACLMENLISAASS